MKHKKIIAFRLPEDIYDLMKELAEDRMIALGTYARVLVVQALARKGFYSLDEDFRAADLIGRDLDDE